jgi:beta-lactamase class A
MAQKTKISVVPVSNGSNRSPIAPRKERKPKFFTNLILYTLRLLILGVGLGAIAGTTLTFVDPKTILGKTAPQTTQSQTKPQTETSKPTEQSLTLTNAVTLTQEIKPLEQKLSALTQKYPKVKAQLYFVDTDNGIILNPLLKVSIRKPR